MDNYASGVGYGAFDQYDGYPSAYPSSFTMTKGTSIGDYAFQGCENLTTVNCPKVTYVSDFAFCDCIGLTSVSLPSATSIESGAFANCLNLHTIDLSSMDSEYVMNKVSDWDLRFGCTITCSDGELVVPDMRYPAIKRDNGCLVPAESDDPDAIAFAGGAYVDSTSTAINCAFNAFVTCVEKPTSVSMDSV